MSLFAIQVAVTVVLIFLTGLGTGWFVMGTFRRAADQACRHELDNLRNEHAAIVQQTQALRLNLKNVEEQKQQALRLLEQSTDRTDFHKVRRQLEMARKQIGVLNAELKRREQQVVKLADLARTMKKQMELRQNPPLKLTDTSIIRLPGLPKMEDDLLAIDGVTPDIAHKLRSLGIINYRQLAESSPEQLHTIQTLIGQGSPLPLDRWVKAAHSLFRVKYAHLFQDDTPQQQSRTA